MKFPMRKICFLIWATILIVPGLAIGQNPFRIIAIVDQTPITSFEVDARIGLLKALSGEDDTSASLGAQVIETLIIETIRIETARDRGILPDEAALDNAFANIAASNNLSPSEFESVLANRGIEISAFKARLFAQIAWNALLSESVRSQAVIDDEELERQWAIIQANKGKTEWLLTEVYIDGGSRSEANQLAANMRENGNFGSFARAVSDSPSAANDGNIGWVHEGNLGPEQESVLEGLRPGQVSAAAPASDGYFIYGVRAVRPVGTSSITELFNLRRLFITLEEGGEGPNDSQKLLTLQNVLKRTSTCERFDQAIEIYGEGDSGALEKTELSALPPRLRQVIGQLKVSQISQLLPEREGAAIYMNCGISTDTDPLTKEQLRQRLLNEKIDELGKDLMIVLRRQTYIEYR